MFKITRKSRLVKVAAATAAVGSIATIGLVGSTPTQADPKQYAALVGVGSDTTQEVMNALSGFSSGINFTPVQSSAASGQRQLVSFDATMPGSTDFAPECIIARTGGPAFERPNGSTAGRAAISRNIEGLRFEDKGRACGTGGVDVRTSIDFARSSSSASGATAPPNQLVYVPFARDALSFAYNRGTTGTAVDTLARLQLQTLFDGDGAASEVVTINTVRILPCGIQVGSGTYGSWATSVGQAVQSPATTSPEEIDATSTCRDLALLGPDGILQAPDDVLNDRIGDADGRLQEHNGVQLAAVGELARTAGIADQVIIGFSASQFIARTNGRGTPAPPATVFLGGISNTTLVAATPGVDCGFPVIANVAQPNFYNNCTGFGRSVFNVFPWATFFRDTDSSQAGFAEGPSIGNNDIKTLFTSTAVNAVCGANALPTLLSSGFLAVGNCGSTTSRGPLLGNPS